MSGSNPNVLALEISATECLISPLTGSEGNKKTEEKMPELADDIRSIVDAKSQADPKFQTSFLYTRITAKAVRQALIDENGYTDNELPCENTMGDILKRMGYKLKQIQKTKPLKNISEMSTM